MDKQFIDKKNILDLDEFGFPVVAMANELLVRQEAYGENREALEEKWEAWLDHHPFDAEVARRLADMYRQRLEQLDPHSDKSTFGRLARKLTKAERRARRYATAVFDQSDTLTRFRPPRLD